MASVSKRSSSPEYEYYDRLAEMKRKMPISWVYILGSCVLWTFISWGVYRGIIYGAMYMRFDDTDLSGFCEEDLEDDPTENLSRLQDVAKGDSWHYLTALGLSAKKKQKSNGKKSNGIADPDLFQFPPIVTAVTSNDFLAVQGLVDKVNSEIRPMFEERAAIKFILYELSLTSSEKEVLIRHCACLVRSLDYQKFPAHVFDWEKHSWKAVLIQFVMKEFGSALWLDPSARPDSTHLRQAAKDARQKGYLLWPEKSMASVVAYTNPPMFTFYKEQRCTHKDSVVIDSTAMMFYATDFTLHGIMTPWLKCVLTENCVAPPHSRLEDCLPGRAPLYTGCHRYDQSALSIVVSRLLVFTENSEKLVPPYRIAETAETVTESFPERPWTRYHRNLAIYGVIMCVISFIFALLFGPLVLECMGVRFKRRISGGHV